MQSNLEFRMSGLPLHQDGSCNDLHHMSALGRDDIGGQCVNLTPSPKPQDMYMDVCVCILSAKTHDFNISTTDVMFSTTMAPPRV